MNWVTEEKTYHPGYRMPLVCFDRPVFPSEDVGPAFQVLFLLEGCLTLEAAGRRYYLKAPEICCIRNLPGISMPDGKMIRSYHAVFLADVVNSRYRNPSLIPVAMPGNFLEQIEYSMFAPFTQSSERLSRYTGDPQSLIRLESLFSSLCGILKNPSDIMWPCRSRSYFLELLLLVYRMSENIESGEVSMGTRADEAASWLHTHYDEKIGLDTLASRFGTNRTSLNSAFNARFNESVMQYLMNIRIRTACNLLRNTELPVSEISCRCGFGDQTQFWRAFRKRIGQNPGDYRQTFPSPYVS